jgi:hypothetical protein
LNAINSAIEIQRTLETENSKLPTKWRDSRLYSNLSEIQATKPKGTWIPASPEK